MNQLFMDAQMDGRDGGPGADSSICVFFGEREKVFAGMVEEGRW